MTLDHYMRRLWQDYGRPKPSAEGSVARPYTIKDLRDVLAEVSGDPEFANDFFDRYVQGRDVVDYQELLGRAGLLLRRGAPGRAWIGPVTLEFSEGAAKISAPTVEDTPVYAAGLDRGDELLSIGGTAVNSPSQLEEAIQRRKPGDQVRVSIRSRGTIRDVTIAIEEDPRLHVIPVEQTGRQLTAAERTFREAWLGSKQ
jgi:predicted metalloprotease with PDZ domain